MALLIDRPTGEDPCGTGSGAFRRCSSRLRAALLLLHPAMSMLAAGAYAEPGGRSCLFTLSPGNAPDWGSLADIDGLMRSAFALATEFQSLPMVESFAIDSVAATADSEVRSCLPSTYLSLPVDEILAHPGFAAGPSSHLVDLGAGLGKPTLRAALLQRASKAVGVELSKSRWEQGCAALRVLSSLLEHPSTRPRDIQAATVELQLGDILEADVVSATHIFIFGTCFPGQLLRALQKQLLQDLPLGAKVFAAGVEGIWQNLTHDMSGAKGMMRAVDITEGEDDIMYRVWQVIGGSARGSNHEQSSCTDSSDL